MVLGNSGGIVLNGNVGIGTSTPSQKLEVPGTIRTTNLQILTGAGAYKILQSDAAGNAAWVPGPTHVLGELYGGGIVFYVYDNGQHGLIAATVNQSAGWPWANTYTAINAARNGILSGKIDTERIIANQGQGYFAAQLCANYFGGNFGDWYLPSKYELNLLYNQKDLVGGFYVGIFSYYWSSTEYDNINAWAQSFSNGQQIVYDKFTTFDAFASTQLRAIRAF